jgi:hypothetical protein
MTYVTEADLASTATGKGAAMVGFIQAAGAAVARTALEKMCEFATFEDFGAVGDALTDGSGTDDTAAIQAALDWAFDGGQTAPRAILMTSKNFLCENITTYPTTCIIGTGKHTSAFICKTGTTDKWFSDRGGGAQKLMISGVAFYGRDLTGLTHVLEFGNEGIQFGTDGILYDLYVRDCANGYGLDLDSNVGNLDCLTLQDCKFPIRVIGNANHLENIYVMEAGENASATTAAIGADLSGCFVRGLHIEATADGALPLKMYGDCHIHDLAIASAIGRTSSHLIEVNETNYLSWAITDAELLGEVSPVTNGILKLTPSNVYRGGLTRDGFSGSHYVRQLDIANTLTARGTAAFGGISNPDLFQYSFNIESGNGIILSNGANASVAANKRVVLAQTSTSGGIFYLFNNAGAVNVSLCGATNTDGYFNTGGKFGIATASPLSTLDNAGSFGTNIRTIAASTTASATDGTILCDATSGAIVLALPAAAGAARRIYTIVKTDASGSAVTIDGNGSETINGAGTKVLSGQWSAATIQCDSTGWVILSEA